MKNEFIPNQVYTCTDPKADILHNDYNDSNSYDGYVFARNDILKRKTVPFHMSNEPLADYYFNNFKQEFTTAKLIKFNGTQYICYDDRAVKRLKRIMEDQLAKLRKKETELQELIKSI